MKSMWLVDLSKAVLGIYGFLLWTNSVGAPVYANVECGETITTNTVLTNDIINCSAPHRWVVRVKGATLNMDGHTIQCSEQPSNTDDPRVAEFGVLLIGKNSRVENGNVRNCSIGIELIGRKHRARNMDVYAKIGIAVRAKGSIVKGNSLLGYWSWNDLCSSCPQTPGILVSPLARKNHIDKNWITRFFYGVEAGGKRNRISDNVIDYGIVGVLASGDDNIINRNTILRENSIGVEIIGSKNDVSSNQVIRSSNGFYVGRAYERNPARLNTLANNHATVNGAIGISLQRADRTRVTKNSAFSNFRLDLRDLSPLCGTNNWIANLHSTFDPECIQ